jgi:Protein of unknown function (DUF3106)
MSRILTISGLLLGVALAGLADQKKAQEPKAAAPPARVTAKPAPGGGTKAPPPSVPRPAANASTIRNPLNPGQRFLHMTPEEQERFMEKANPQQQERLRQAIENYKRLPQPVKELLFRQYQVLNALPPAQQVLITRQIAAFNNKLPEDRRGVVKAEFLRLRQMAEADRTARLASDEFKSKYTPEERQILKDLSENIPPEYPLGR